MAMRISKKCHGYKLWVQVYNWKLSPAGNKRQNLFFFRNKSVSKEDLKCALLSGLGFGTKTAKLSNRAHTERDRVPFFIFQKTQELVHSVPLVGLTKTNNN